MDENSKGDAPSQTEVQPDKPVVSEAVNQPVTSAPAPDDTPPDAPKVTFISPDIDKIPNFSKYCFCFSPIPSPSKMTQQPPLGGDHGQTQTGQKLSQVNRKSYFRKLMKKK